MCRHFKQALTEIKQMAEYALKELQPFIFVSTTGSLSEGYLKFALDVLSSTEMSALLTTMTANILGLAVIVLKGLFRKA